MNFAHPASRVVMGFMGVFGVGLIAVAFFPSPPWSAKLGVVFIGLYGLFFGFVLPLRYRIAS